jgi:hypothetical protein
MHVIVFEPTKSYSLSQENSTLEPMRELEKSLRLPLGTDGKDPHVISMHWKAAEVQTPDFWQRIVVLPETMYPGWHPRMHPLGKTEG